MVTRRLLTKLLVLAPLCALAATPKAPVVTSIDGVSVQPDPASTINIAALPTTAGPNTSAYQTLNVRAMAAGASFADPVTGVRTVKLTANGTPSSAQFWNQYATLGLQISQSWGTNGANYTLMFQSGGTIHLVDYRLGGTTSNYRTLPNGTEGKVAFSRLAGQERIAYVLSGSQLRKYDTGSNAWADTGGFPRAWSGTGQWLQLNANETWATALSSGGGVTALRTTDGTVLTQSMSGVDEIYGGYNNVALINAGSNSRVWNLDTNTLSAVTLPSSNFSRIFHVPSLRGFWAAIDSNSGNGVMPITRIGENGVGSATVSRPSYWGQLHMSGHWWAQPAGTAQYLLYSNWDNSSSWTASQRYVIGFVRCSDGEQRILGHSYTEAQQSGTRANGTDNYRAQPHATQSTDGKLVMFTSNMLDGPRTDVFLMEVPRS
jgi:hypothetical protein